MLDHLYLRYLLGDRYINSYEINDKHSRNSFAFMIDSHSEDSAQYLNILQKRVHDCRLCNISKMTKDRLCAMIPKGIVTIKIAFIVDMLILRESSNDIDSLDNNIDNATLLHCIEHICGFDPAQVFIIPLIKCIDTTKSNMIKHAMLNNSINEDINICKEYLLMQLESIDYAVFFGKRLCRLIFDLSIKDSIGKLLTYKTTKGKQLTCVCLEDLHIIAGNDSVKRDTIMNLAMLKSAMRF